MLDIRHIWFDFSDTIAHINKEERSKLAYKAFAEVQKKTEITSDLIAEYEKHLEKHNKSNSAVFHSLGMPAHYWSDRLNAADPKKIYSLIDPEIPDVLKKLKDILPISIFSNLELKNVLPSFGIDPGWFTHIISSKDVQKPKPALDGFYKMIELSGVPQGTILYIGDEPGKDVAPAKHVGILAGILWRKSPEADFCFEKFRDILSLVEREVSNNK